eukprot:8569733-Heterocapsa_arctica.AAC.1
MALWMFTFTDLNIIVTNQQNTSNKVFQETVQKFADKDSEWLKTVHVLVSETAWDDAMKQQKLHLDPNNKAKIALFADARLAVVTMGMITGYRKGFAQCRLDHRWDYHVIDEMQCMNGDHQLLCGRVKRPGS